MYPVDLVSWHALCTIRGTTMDDGGWGTCRAHCRARHRRVHGNHSRNAGDVGKRKPQRHDNRHPPPGIRRRGVSPR